MNNKSIFTNTIKEIGNHANLSANECEKYGMTWGCDGDCPVFSSGKCKMEDIPTMRNLILNTHCFDDYDLDDLNKLYPQLELK